MVKLTWDSNGRTNTINLMVIDFGIHRQPYLTSLVMPSITTTAMPLFLPLHNEGNSLFSVDIISRHRTLSAIICLRFRLSHLCCPLWWANYTLFQIDNQFWVCAQCQLHVHRCLDASFLTAERHARCSWWAAWRHYLCLNWAIWLRGPVSGGGCDCKSMRTFGGLEEGLTLPSPDDTDDVRQGNCGCGSCLYVSGELKTLVSLVLCAELCHLVIRHHQFHRRRCHYCQL